MGKDIRFASLLGIGRQNNGNLMQMPMSDRVQNHIGSMHASAQFALAEIGSGDFLRQQYPSLSNKVHAVVRRAEIKYSKQVNADLVAHPYINSDDQIDLEQKLATKGRVILPVHVKLKTQEGEVATHAVYHWYITLKPD